MLYQRDAIRQFSIFEPLIATSLLCSITSMIWFDLIGVFYQSGLELLFSIPLSPYSTRLFDDMRLNTSQLRNLKILWALRASSRRSVDIPRGLRIHFGIFYLYMIFLEDLGLSTLDNHLCRPPKPKLMKDIIGEFFLSGPGMSNELPRYLNRWQLLAIPSIVN